MRYHMLINTKTGETTMEPMAATTDDEARTELDAIVDNCPECQAARARGEVPIKGTGVPPWFKRPRWRDLKRRVPRR